MKMKKDYINPEYGSHRVPMDELIPLIRERLAANHSVKLSPKGVSMLPMLRDGMDTVTLSPVDGKLKKYDIPLYKRENGQYVLHRIVKVNETGYTCIGDNQFVYEKNVPHSSVIAVVTSFTRKGKSRSVNSPSYRIYCRFWHLTRLPRRIFRAVRKRLARVFKRKTK